MVLVSRKDRQESSRTCERKNVNTERYINSSLLPSLYLE